MVWQRGPRVSLSTCRVMLEDRGATVARSTGVAINMSWFLTRSGSFGGEVLKHRYQHIVAVTDKIRVVRQQGPRVLLSIYSDGY